MQRREAWIRWALPATMAWLAALAPPSARAQDEVRDFARKPILMAETDGHHAPVRCLAWLDNSTLLSGGEDKVVKVWDLREGDRPSRTIRPVLWRGPRGAIRAMAVTSRPDGQGQSLLAVGGYGVEASGGDMTIFRVPGLTRNPSGDVVKRLVRPPGNVGQTTAHNDLVRCLAFNPDGTILASGSQDQTIILWDVAADFRPIRVLRRHTGSVSALAFSRDGTRLASAGSDGLLAIWDVAQGQVVDFLPTRVPLNTLAYIPDEPYIVVGAENGALIKVSTIKLGQNGKSLRAGDGKPIELVAYRPDGRHLAVSVKSDVVAAPDPMTISCDIELRAMPNGDVVQRWPRVHGLVRAMSFSPDGNRLAYSGGPAQAISIRELGAPQAKPRELRGKGSTPFDLGFTKDSQVVGFTRETFEAGHPPLNYEGFDMVRRAARTVPRDQLVGAIKEYAGWTIRPSRNPFGLEAVNADGRRSFFRIDVAMERWWWCWTFVPPAPSHPRAIVAVGTEVGIAVFNLETGERTHGYAGHAAPVVSLAPSPDGRWLASGSQDQTVMLYPLAGSDTLPRLGATFRPGADGALTVAEVERRSFAAAMGLERGDVVIRAGIGSRHFNKPEELAELGARVDKEPPGLNQVGIWIRRMVSVPTVGVIPLEVILPTTKRNNAAFTILLDTDKEWVVWMPQGYYDTSIEGDARLLGWHINPPYRSSRPTDFVPLVTYSATMARPDILDRLWRTGDLDQALAVLPPSAKPPEAQVAANQPPRIRFESVQGSGDLPAPGVLWRVSVPRPKVKVKVAADPGMPAVRERKVIFDERPLTDPGEDIPLELIPNRRVRLSVEAVGVDDSRRVESIDMIYVQPPQAPPPPPRLFVLSIGTDQLDDSQLAPVRFAGGDARELAGFLAEHLVSTDASKIQAQEPHILTGNGASAGSIANALDRLNDLVVKKKVNKGDVVAVAIAAHVLEVQDATIIAAADSQVGPPSRSVVATRDLCDVLGHLTDYGCRVIVFLDGVHKVNEPLVGRIKPLVRDLYQKRGVITFVASKEDPSDVDVPGGHRIFALALLRVFQGAGAAGNRREAYTLDQFKTSLRDTVLELSERRQEASCYIPLQVPEQTWFARP